MSSDVVLTSALRNNLLSLQKTQSNIDKVQNALSSGLKVSSALDNPQSYFTARSLNNRASDLGSLLDGIGQSISSLKQTNTAVDKVTKLVEQANSIISQAADAAADAQIASVTGNVDLSEVDNITSLAGVAASNQLVISVNNPNDPLAANYAVTVTLSANDSIDQVLAKINSAGGPTPGTPNGSFDSAGEAVVEASITSEGFLKIAAANGGKLNVEFKAAETNAAIDDATNLALARALGFGGQAQLVAQTGAAVDNDVSITALGGNALVSGRFMKAATGSEYADASAVLSSVYDEASSRSVRFATTASTTTDKLDIIINNTTTVSIGIVQGVTTIQGLVDSINTNATLKGAVEASYDANTGQFSIAKTSSKVQTIEISNSPGTGAVNGTVEMDFDFGLTNLSTATQTIDVSEVFTFGSSAGTLGQLEKDFNKVREQIDGLIGDSKYAGANLLKGEDLVTYFNADRTNSLTTTGADLTASGMGLDKADFSSTETISGYRTAVKGALDSLRSFGGSLANDLNIIQNREEFTKETVSNLTEGADKLTVADQNEEGAKLLALQTRQQLGVTALSLAAQAQQSVLRLF